MTHDPDTTRTAPWLILAASTIGMGMGFGVTSSFAVFMAPLEQTFGWSRADVSFGYTLMTIGMAGGGLLWGRLADTRHLRGVVVLGALVLAFGLMAASRIESVLQLHTISLLLGAAGFACLFAPLASVVGLWFTRRRGLAIGILTAGGAVGQGLVPLLMEWAIAGLGWRGAYLWSGVAYLVILVPLMALITRAPQTPASAAAASSNSDGWPMAPRASTAWLSLAGFLCCFCMAVPLVHVVSVVCHHGHTTAAGAGILFTIMAVGAAGRIAIGMLADRTGALPAYMVSSLLQTATVFWFVTTPQMAIIIPVAIVFGFGFAGNMTSLILAVREAMPADRVGRATGRVGMVAWLGMGAGGYVSGLLFDVTAAYTASFALAAAAGAANLLVLILLHRRVAGHPNSLTPGSRHPPGRGQAGGIQQERDCPNRRWKVWGNSKKRKKNHVMIKWLARPTGGGAPRGQAPEVFDFPLLYPYDLGTTLGYHRSKRGFMADTKHLEMRGLRWWYNRKVPKDLRPHMRDSHAGRTQFRRNLKTSDLRVAQQLRGRAASEFATELAVARKRASGGASVELEVEADAWAAGWHEENGFPHGPDYDLAAARAQEIARMYGEQPAQRFYRTAVRAAGTAIDKHLERWLAENKRLAPRTVGERRKIVETLAQWRGGLDAERIDRGLARAFVEEVIAPKSAPATINKKVDILAQYWRWLMGQGHIPEGAEHWSKFRVKAPREPATEKERPFTADEMEALFTKRPMRPELYDAALMSALLGARLNEIASLRAEDVNLSDMTIHLPGTKTEAAERTIPLHHALKRVVARRLNATGGATAWLFPELPERAAESPRSRGAALSQAFTRHRRAVGVDDCIDGKRRARANFHSFRRWFITEAERAGGQPWVFASIVGHKREGMSLGLYSAGPTIRQMRAVMAKVKLPPGIPVEPAEAPQK